MDHCAAEVNLDSEFVVVGDPEVLWSAPSLTADVLCGRQWATVDLPAGRVLCVAGTAGEDGPWLFVTTTSDGPLQSVSLRPSIWTDEATRTDEDWVTLSSGRLVVGEPRTVRAWGPTVDVEGDGVAEARMGVDAPEQRYVGLVVVVRTPKVDQCTVEVAFTPSAGLHAVSLRPPVPGWAPPLMKP